MDSIIISRIDTNVPEYGQVFSLRDKILRQPLGMSLKNDDLSRDFIDEIFIAKHGDKVIGCLMLHHKDAGHLQLRQMAVDEEWQGKGVGKKIVTAAEQFASDNGYRKMVLHARKVAVGFYHRLGYKIIGDEFTEVNIPHFLMEKEMT